MEINYIIVITTDGRESMFTNVKDYKYDSDYIRIYYTEELDRHVAVSVFPKSNVVEFNVDFKKGGDSNA